MTTISNHSVQVSRTFADGGPLNLADVPFLQTWAIKDTPTAMHRVEVDGAPMSRSARGTGLQAAIGMAHEYRKITPDAHITIHRIDYGDAS